MAKKRVDEEEIEKAVSDAFREFVNAWLFNFFKRAAILCITATLALTGGLYKFGEYLYINSEATQAAIDTFIDVKKQNDKI